MSEHKQKETINMHFKTKTMTEKDSHTEEETDNKTISQIL